MRAEECLDRSITPDPVLKSCVKFDLCNYEIALSSGLPPWGENKPHLHESSNPGSTHFRSQTEFQSTNGCGWSQSGYNPGSHWK